MTQLGYIYESEKKEILLAVSIIYDDKICHIRYLVQDFPKSDTISTKSQSFVKTEGWKEFKAKHSTLYFEEKFNDFPKKKTTNKKM